MAAMAGALIVSVAAAELVPGVTDVGDRAQVGVGAGPLAAHESWIALPKDPPVEGAIVMTSVT